MLLLTVDLFQISFMCTRTHIIINYSEGMFLLTVDLFQISFMCSRTHIIINYSEGMLLLTVDLFQISFMCSHTYKVKCVQLKNVLLLQSFMKLFHSQHSQDILDSTWWNNSSYTL